jgi:[ribosomal protein S18]-alanine N-acetyltransferase
MPAATLRDVGPFDVETLAALHAACFADAWSAAAMAALLTTPGTFSVLALTADQPAGFAMARVAAEDAEILSLCVLPRARRRGIGAALMVRVGASARQRGARAMFLEVAEDDSGARRFYQIAGFVEVGRRPGYYRRGDGRRANALVLRRQLEDWLCDGQEKPPGR